MFKYVVNMQRPLPDGIELSNGKISDGENARFCEYVEKLRATDDIKVNSLYRLNLEQLNEGQQCVYGGGKYMFWFKDKPIAEKFIADLSEFAIKPLNPWIADKIDERTKLWYEENHTRVIELENTDG